jgi:hypothetical protein
VAAFAKNREATQSAVGIEMRATRGYERRTTMMKSPHPRLMESMRYLVEEAKIFEFKGLTGKIRKTKELTLQDPFRLQPPLQIWCGRCCAKSTTKWEFSTGGFQNGKEVGRACPDLAEGDAL